jgi:hypothetical protein
METEGYNFKELIKTEEGLLLLSEIINIPIERLHKTLVDRGEIKQES